MLERPYSKLLPQGASSSDTRDTSFHEMLLDSLHDGVYFVDAERKITYWNRGAEVLTGYTASEVIGRYCFDNLLSHVDENGKALCVEGCPLAATIADGQRREVDVYLRHKLGHRVPVSIRAAAIADSTGANIGAVETFSDATGKKNVERRAGVLEDLAFRDALTGVPNRLYIGLKVKEAIEEFELLGRSFGLLMIDVDRFKQVNDEHGHEIGDHALKAMCKTLTHNLRAADAMGRWGGEEFLAVIADVDQHALGTFAERCRMLIAESAVPLSTGELRITAAFGATLVREGDSDQAVIKRADELMYRSKADGGNRVTIG
jgi:diguanylate cyclase (GGDEF)-like protein/PAS domain S-box-containing protein